MSNSKLGQTLMRTIEGGKSKGEFVSDIAIDDAFDQAETSGVSAEFKESESNTEALSIKAPHIADAESFDSPGDPDVRGNPKPKIVKPPKQKKAGNFIGVIALLVSVSAATVAGYLVVTQQAGYMATENNMERLDAAIGTLTTRADELTTDLSGIKNGVQSTSDRLYKIEGIQSEIKHLQLTVSTLSEDLISIKDDLQTNTVSINTNLKQINELTGQVKKLSAKPAVVVPSKVVQKEPVIQTNTEADQIEGAYVASIDLWGTQPYVMLRDDQGRWVPLTMGDYYKGWRLEGAIGSEAVFQNGPKSKRIKVKE